MKLYVNELFTLKDLYKTLKYKDKNFLINLETTLESVSYH